MPTTLANFPYQVYLEFVLQGVKMLQTLWFDLEQAFELHRLLLQHWDTPATPVVAWALRLAGCSGSGT